MHFHFNFKINISCDFSFFFSEKVINGVYAVLLKISYQKCSRAHFLKKKRAHVLYTLFLWKRCPKLKLEKKKFFVQIANNQIIDQSVSRNERSALKMYFSAHLKILKNWIYDLPENIKVKKQSLYFLLCCMYSLTSHLSIYF